MTDCQIRIGSLFSGAGGLDMAVENIFGGRTVWHCENDSAASKVLAARWPGVPNLGDITNRSDEDNARAGLTPTDVTEHLLPTPMAHDAKGTGPSGFRRNTPELSRIDHYFPDLLPTPNASDGTGGGQHPDRRGGHSRQLCDYALLLATPSAADGGGDHINRSGERKGELLLPGQAREMAVSWGKYGLAIRRWENLTRPAPAPTEPNKNGNPRLAAAFSEWLMGWPTGGVTQVLGISRNDQLRIIGNGVVPQQAVAALRWLLNVSEVSA